MSELIEDEDRRTTGLALAGWGFVAVLATVGAVGAWQFAPARSIAGGDLIARAAPLGDPAETTGSIARASGDASGRAARPAPQVLPADGQAASIQDFEALRADIRELQKKVQQGTTAGLPSGAFEQLSRRLATVEDRLDKLEAGTWRRHGAAGAARDRHGRAARRRRSRHARRRRSSRRGGPDPAGRTRGRRARAAAAAEERPVQVAQADQPPARPPLSVSVGQGNAQPPQGARGVDMTSTGTVAKPPMPVKPVPVQVPLQPVTSVDDDMKSLMDKANGGIDKPISNEPKPVTFAIPMPKPADLAGPKPTEASVAADAAAKASPAPAARADTLQTAVASAQAPSAQAPSAQAPSAQAAPVQTATAQAPAGQALALQAAAPAAGGGAEGPIAVDLGSYKSLAGLKRTWVDLEKRHAEATNGIGALAQIKETKDGTEIRLVAGPYANSADAAKACARFKTAGFSCSAGTFIGQPIR
ncbi:SPOR domain-containing protein [Methyloraptor flagellatus]|uniref:SPOR domain-containing protein n=1 Tax=Methyloraptor flagellatus TaxID=3162530 RepID=A0AAU7XDV4_9HYPH